MLETGSVHGENGLGGPSPGTGGGLGYSHGGIAFGSITTTNKLPNDLLM
ncbi:unnamed protein product, partial [Protopolystoma xenopodis]